MPRRDARLGRQRQLSLAARDTPLPQQVPERRWDGTGCHEHHLTLPKTRTAANYPRGKGVSVPTTDRRIGCLDVNLAVPGSGRVCGNACDDRRYINVLPHESTAQITKENKHV